MVQYSEVLKLSKTELLDQLIGAEGTRHPSPSPRRSHTRPSPQRSQHPPISHEERENLIDALSQHFLDHTLVIEPDRSPDLTQKMTCN